MAGKFRNFHSVPPLKKLRRINFTRDYDVKNTGHEFYRKIGIFSVKSTLLQKKLLKSWFHEIFTFTIPTQFACGFFTLPISKKITLSYDIPHKIIWFSLFLLARKTWIYNSAFILVIFWIS